MTIDWTAQLVGQLEFYWDVHLRPRLEGLTDDEYLWEPVDGCWSIRQGEDGRWRMETSGKRDGPITTIAWRMAHVSVGIFGTRASTFFGDGSVPDDADMFDARHEPASLPATAADGIALLENNYRWWRDGISALDEAGLAKPLGPKGNMFAKDPMAALILHLNREAMHHGGEIGLMRDLYARKR